MGCTSPAEGRGRQKCTPALQAVSSRDLILSSQIPARLAWPCATVSAHQCAVRCAAPSTWGVVARGSGMPGRLAAGSRISWIRSLAPAQVCRAPIGEAEVGAAGERRGRAVAVLRREPPQLRVVAAPLSRLCVRLEAGGHQALGAGGRQRTGRRSGPLLGGPPGEGAGRGGP